MANLNKVIVIQLKDAGIYDIITDFDTEYVHTSFGCPTCGSFDTDYIISNIIIVSTIEENKIELNRESDDIIDDVEQWGISQMDLQRVLLNEETINYLKTITLEEFYHWINKTLGGIAREKIYKYWGEKQNDSNY